LSSITPTATVPAGWFDDPTSAAQWRWWDGYQWTAHVSAKAAPAAEVVTPEAAAVPATAEPVSTYRPFANASYGNTGYTGALSNYGTPVPMPMVGSPNTLGIWLMAFLPAMMLVLVGVTSFLTGLARLPYNFPVQVFYLAILIPAWVFAGLDIYSLRRRGYRPASILWMLLLPPLFYLIFRGRVVRRAGQKAWPPELAYFLCVVGVYALNATLSVVLLSGLGATGTQNPYANPNAYPNSGTVQNGTQNPPAVDPNQGTPPAAYATPFSGPDYLIGTVNPSGDVSAPTFNLIDDAFEHNNTSLSQISCSGGVAIGSTSSCTVEDFADNTVPISVTISSTGEVSLDLTGAGPLTGAAN